MRTIIVTVSVVALLLAGICSVEADPSPFTAFTTTGTIYSTGLSPARTVGWAFTTNAPLTINSLGYYDHGGDGLVNSHEIGIWDLSENLLGSAKVLLGTLGTLENAFRWVDVSPISLDAGQTYVVGAWNHGGFGDDFVLVKSDAENLVFDPAVTFVEGRYEAWTMGLTYPGSVSSIDLTTHLNANFKGNVVPIPSAVWLLGSGLIGLLGVRRRFRKG